MRRLAVAIGLALAVVLTSPVAVPQAVHAQAGDETGLSDLLGQLWRGGGESGEPAPPDETLRRVPLGQDEVQLSFAPLVTRTGPAVVNVYASQEVRQRARSPFEGDPFFEHFFGRQMPPRVQSSLGSGVLVDGEGHVVTNYHVIRNADQVRVATPDGREFDSEVLLTDEALDLAVLRIEDDEAFAYADLGDSDALEVGDLVLAIGNPFGVGQTTTSGIVSALARTHVGVNDFGFFIQTDAAINPGNSGGALINMAGEVIGINTAIFTRTGGSIGIGFAIPSNVVRAVVESARAGLDYFERPYIGADFESVTPEVAEALGMVRPLGALVSSVVPEGPAERSGLRAGDVVLAFNGSQIEHPDALGYRLATQEIGTSARMDILSQGEDRSIDIALERAPEGASSAEIVIAGHSPFAGARAAALSPRIAQRLGVRTQHSAGAAIIEVSRGSTAAEVGFRPGDIVLEVNGARIESAEDLNEAAQEQTRWWRFALERDGRRLNQVLRY